MIEASNKLIPKASLPPAVVLCVLMCLTVSLSVQHPPPPLLSSDHAGFLCFWKETTQPQQAHHFVSVVTLFLVSLLAMKPLKARGEHQDGNGHKQTAVKGDILPRGFNLAQVLDGQGFVHRCWGKYQTEGCKTISFSWSDNCLWQLFPVSHYCHYFF